MPHPPIDDLPLASTGWARQMVEHAWIQAVNAKDWTAVDARIACGEDPHDLAGRLFLLPRWLDDPRGGGAERLQRWQAAGVDLLRFRLVQEPLDLNHGALDAPYTSVRPLLYTLERAVRTDAEMAGILGVLLDAGARWRNAHEEGLLLRQAIVQHRTSALDVLIEHGLNPQVRVNDPMGDDPMGTPPKGPLGALYRSALHLAAAYGTESLVRRLTQAGLDPNQSDPDGNAPLHLALQHPRAHVQGVLHALFDAGADPHLKTKKLAPQALAKAMEQRGRGCLDAWTRAWTAHEQRVLRAQLPTDGSNVNPEAPDPVFVRSRL